MEDKQTFKFINANTSHDQEIKYILHLSFYQELLVLKQGCEGQDCDNLERWKDNKLARQWSSSWNVTDLNELDVSHCWHPAVKITAKLIDRCLSFTMCQLEK